MRCFGRFNLTQAARKLVELVLMGRVKAVHRSIRQSTLLLLRDLAAAAEQLGPHNSVLFFYSLYRVFDASIASTSCRCFRPRSNPVLFCIPLLDILLLPSVCIHSSIFFEIYSNVFDLVSFPISVSLFSNCSDQ